MFAYGDNGHAFRAWKDPFTLAYGEVFFDHRPTVEELQQAFVHYDNGPTLPVPAAITRRQCARELLNRTLISGDEALAMTRAGTPPAMVLAMVDQMPEADRIPALIDFAADTYLRDNPLLVALMTATGANSAAIDAFFRAAAVL